MIQILKIIPKINFIASKLFIISFALEISEKTTSPESFKCINVFETRQLNFINVKSCIMRREYENIRLSHNDVVSANGTN